MNMISATEIKKKLKNV